MLIYLVVPSRTPVVLNADAIYILLYQVGDVRDTLRKYIPRVVLCGIQYILHCSDNNCNLEPGGELFSNFVVPLHGRSRCSRPVVPIYADVVVIHVALFISRVQ